MKNSKQLCVLVVLAMLCALVFSCGTTGGAAKATDAAPPTPTLATGEWMVYDDVESDKGSSTVKIVSATEVIDGKEVMVHHVTGNVTTKYKYGFAGWGLNADEATMNLYKTAKSLSFWILGDGLKYTIKFKTSNITDFGYFQYSFITEKDTPMLIQVPMKYFMQPSWAASAMMKQNLVTGVEWQTHEDWRKDPNNNPFDIKIWDFTVYN